MCDAAQLVHTVRYGHRFPRFAHACYYNSRPPVYLYLLRARKPISGGARRTVEEQSAAVGGKEGRQAGVRCEMRCGGAAHVREGFTARAITCRVRATEERWRTPASGSAAIVGSSVAPATYAGVSRPARSSAIMSSSSMSSSARAHAHVSTRQAPGAHPFLAVRRQWAAAHREFGSTGESG